MVTFAPGPAAVFFETRGVKFYFEYGGPRPMHTWEWGVVIRKFSEADNGYINVGLVDDYPPASIPAGVGYPQTLQGARDKLVDETVKALNEAIATYAPAAGAPVFTDTRRQATYTYLVGKLAYDAVAGLWSRKP